MNRQPAGNKRASLFAAIGGATSTGVQHQRGISLVETLVAMILGLLVLAGVLQLTSQLVEGNTSTLKIVRLEQDLRTVMDSIVQDLRRSGSFPEAAADLGQPAAFLQNQPIALTLDGELPKEGVAAKSIAYAYRESGGQLVQGRFTFDAKAGTLQMHTGTASAPETITDPAFMNVTEFSLTPHLVHATVGNLQAQVLAIDIEIVARLKSDSSFERRLTDRVLIRNDTLSAAAVNNAPHARPLP